MSMNMGTEGQSQGQPNPRPVVNVQAKVVAQDGAKGIEYRLEPNNADAAAYVTGPTEMKFPRGDALYKVHFHLDDKDCRQKLKFDHAQPMCAADGADCPSSVGIKATDLDQPDKHDERWLAVDNYNSREGPIGFALYFRDQHSDQPVEPFDPIMQNGGGGTPRLR